MVTDRAAWRATVHGVTVLDTERLNKDKISWATLLVLRDCLLGVFVETEGAAPGGVSLHALP